MRLFVKAFISGVWLVLASTTSAAPPPLIVAVARYSPPFVMQDTKNTWTGFDISMMNYICQILQRPCVYKPMPFEQLFSALTKQEADVAISAITITLARAKDVNFSMPYLSSQSRFLAATELTKTPFSPSLLTNKKIGVEKGTIFAEQLQTMNLAQTTIVDFDSEEEVVDALNKNQIDLALLDDPDANYWMIHSNGALSPLGPKMDYGQGYGIAINPNQPSLVSSINDILKAYIGSEQYKQNHQIYFGSN